MDSSNESQINNNNQPNQLQNENPSQNRIEIASNLQRQNIEQNNLANNNHIDYSKKYTKLTISFLIFLIINLIIEIYSQFDYINKRKYIFQFGPIYYKKQYYRFISNHFIHFGICHLIVEMYITYRLFYSLENMMGTLFTLAFIVVSMIFNSFIHFLIMPLMIFLFQWLPSSYDRNLDYESGLAPVLFSVFKFYFLFNKNSVKRVEIAALCVVEGRYLPLICFFTLDFLTPNRTTYGNFCGIISAYILKYYPSIFLPKISWLKEIEQKFKLYKLEPFYRYITPNNRLMKESLNEYESGSMNEDLKEMPLNIEINQPSNEGQNNSS